MIRLRVCIKGAGEKASAVAWRLYQAHLRQIVMLELPEPLAVRRMVSFSEAVYAGFQTVEGVQAVRVDGVEAAERSWAQGQIAVAVDPENRLSEQLRPEVVVDARLAKKNLDTTMEEAPLVIALGPGFLAGRDAHYVIETNRGHDLGRIIQDGYSEADTGMPGNIDGFAEERVLRAPAAGLFLPLKKIGDPVKQGEIIAQIGEEALEARIDGVLRGLMRPFACVAKGLKLGDIDPRGDVDACHSISDKARAVAGSVLEAILRNYNV